MLERLVRSHDGLNRVPGNVLWRQPNLLQQIGTTTMREERLWDSKLPDWSVDARGAQLLSQPRSVTTHHTVVLDGNDEIMIASEIGERRTDRQGPDRVNDRHADPLVR